MNLIDSIYLIILIYGSYKGFKNGIVGEVLSFLGILLGVYLSKTYYLAVDKYLVTVFDSTNQLISLISVILIFTLTIMLSKILSKVITNALNIMALGLLNKLIGSVFGLLKYLLILCIITFIISKANDLFVLIETNTIEETQIFSKIQEINDYILN
tara:strand:- start:231 stop:698 length:468 start_codon:yes stop_codon:yes gene_type:complete